jgi:hypothetical protein
MARVIVLELPDDVEFAAVLRTVEGSLGQLPEGCRVFGAIREDADAVLQVFKADA